MSTFLLVLTHLLAFGLGVVVGFFWFTYAVVLLDRWKSS